VIATGTPEQVAEVEESYTGQFLRKVLPGVAAAAA
jgi:excinuclease ABC subunit A